MSEISDNKLASCLGFLVIAIGAVVYSTLVSGLVLAVLWGWFIVPIFKLPELTTVQAIGVGYVVSYLTQRLDMSSNKGEEESVGLKLGKLFAAATGKAIIFLAFGYIIKSLM